MAVHFHPLTVKKIIKETDDCVSVEFDVPAELKETFNFIAGQNITIKHPTGQADERRSYSLCTSPASGKIKVAVKQVAGGLFSTYANENLQQGDLLEVMPPVGKFTVKKTTGNYLAIAAGSGITPVLSIITHILSTQSEANVTLVYGNKNRQGIIFFEELEALKNIYMNRLSCVYVLSKEHTDTALNFGRIDLEKLNALKHIIDYENLSEAFLCGPEAMIFTAAEFLQNVGMNKEDIHFELFTTPGKKKESTAEIITDIIDTGKRSAVTIRLDGRSMRLDVPYVGDAILDAALKQGADLPFACKGGVCCTCRAKLISGEVKMDVNYALEKEEVEAGFILTCQSHPLTDEVVIDFDVR